MVTVTPRQRGTGERVQAPPRVQPSAQPKGDTLTVTDSRGRVLTVNKLSLLEEMNLLAAAGAERAAIQRWMLYATVISTVRMIDGSPLSPPMTQRILLSNVQEVGAEGFAAAASVLAEDLPPDVLEMPGEDDVGAMGKF